jgi:hypothetical protein
MKNGVLNGTFVITKEMKKAGIFASDMIKQLDSRFRDIAKYGVGWYHAETNEFGDDVYYWAEQGSGQFVATHLKQLTKT